MTLNNLESRILNKQNSQDEMDVNNELFLTQLQDAQNQYLANNPEGFMRVNEAMLGQQQPIPLAPEASNNITKTREDGLDSPSEVENLTIESSPTDVTGQSPLNPALQPSSDTQTTDYRDRLLQELKALREQNKRDLEGARQRDDLTKLYDAGNQIGSQLAQAIANRAGYTNVKTSPLRLQGQEESRQLSDNKTNLQSLMDEYKLLADKDKAKFDKDRQEAERKYKQQVLDLQKQKLSSASGKEDKQLKKENRKVRQGLEQSNKAADEQLSVIDKAIKQTEDLMKTSTFVDTGPLDQYLLPFTSKGQKLKQTYNDLGLTKMVKMFQGMSKAIDSDSERKYFEQSLASLGNYPDVNLEILKDLRNRIEQLKQQNMIDMSKYTPEGDYVESEALPQQTIQSSQGSISSAPYGEEVERNGKTYIWNQSVGKYQLK